MNSNLKKARIAGFLYLLVIVTGIFAQVSRSSFIVTEDAQATAQNIKASEMLFRMSLVSDLLMISCYLLLACTLFLLLKPVNKSLAQLFVLFTTVSVAIMSLNMLNQFAALLLLSETSYLTIFETNELSAQAMFFLDLHKQGYLIAQIFFGLWLFPLGYLVLKSGFFPRVLGMLLILATFGHLIEIFTAFLFPNYAVVTYPGLIIATIGEFSFCFWLLIKGAKEGTHLSSEPV
jgi:hypothetical protein